MTGETALTIQAWSAAAQVVATAVLVLITGYYAAATRGMLREMETSRRRSQEARVFAYAEQGEHGPVMVVRNAGAGPAFGVRVTNRSPGEFKTVEGDSILPGSSIVQGLFLAPGQAVKSMAAFATFGSKPEDHPPVDVLCEWEEAEGAARSERSVVNVGSVLFTVNPGSLAEIEHSLRDLRFDLRS